jgi:predicted SnoaL-like aldol condensation-catalyzing enzyme
MREEVIMKYLVLLCAVTFLFAACASIQPKQEVGKMKLSNKEKVVALLESIQTGDQKPVAFINPDKYIQHNLMVADGLKGFGEVLQQLPKGSAKAKVVRAFQDGNYVFSHTEYDFFGPKIGFDIFRFENGNIVEHWDNLQEIVAKTASGRSQTDGPTEVTDLDKTQLNKSLVEGFVRDILRGGNPSKITDYISTEKYYQHNPAVADGLDALGKALQEMAKAGMPMTYTNNHMVLGEGNFVLAVSEGQFLNKHVAFYDLFRIENGRIVEHWDTVEEIPPRENWKNSNGKF